MKNTLCPTCGYIRWWSQNDQYCLSPGCDWQTIIQLSKESKPKSEQPKKNARLDNRIDSLTQNFKTTPEEKEWLKNHYTNNPDY